MNTGVLIVAIVFMAALVLALGWYLLIYTEGVLLGKRIVIALYDLYADRYDRIKQFDDVDEHVLIAQPLMRAAANPAPLVLDVATGTGRLPLALCQHARFEGRIIGTDLAQRMLQKAQEKMEANAFSSYVALVRADAAVLPFPEAAFDVVTCLEALEFFTDPQRCAAEMARVLKPGGVLLTTQRQNASQVPRVPSEQETMRMLERSGFTAIRFEDWQHDYRKVWARRETRQKQRST
jgi:ubiquinone/menaquinone biosynthesis C-methylase UbiE